MVVVSEFEALFCGGGDDEACEVVALGSAGGSAGAGLAARSEASKKAFASTAGCYGDRARASARAFASGNRWAEENARAVGNW